MAGISFSGISSGIDWDALREALMAVERRPLIRLTDQQDTYETQKNAFNDINSRLGNLLGTVTPLLDQVNDLFKATTATSSDTNVVTATADDTAVSGTYDIRVQQLATAESVISAVGATVSSFTAGFAGTDLNADIDAATTLVGSLHRRDNAASFVDADLGQMVIDDGVTNVTVDLTAGGITTASTVNDLITAVNSQLSAGGSQVTVGLNGTGDGLLFTSGTGNVSISDGGDGKQTATKFGVVTAGLVPSPVDSGDLDPDLQTDTPLSVLNGGSGVTDLTSGLVLHLGTSSATVDLSTATTVNDVINAINGAGLNVTASLDGGGKALRVDTGDTNRSLGIEENGGTTASDLGLFGSSNALQIKTAADASYFNVYLDGASDGNSADLTVSDISASINAVSGASFTSSVIDGRLVIQSNSVGSANGLQVIDDQANNGILEQLGILISDPVDNSTISNAYSSDNTQGGYLQTAADAVFSVNGVVVTRSQNTGITDVISGVTLDLQGVSSSTGPTFPTDYASTTLAVARDDASLTDAVEAFVNQYNSVVDFLNDLTKINPEGEDGTLAGNSVAEALKTGLYTQSTALLPDTGQVFRSLFELRDSNGNYAIKLSEDNSGKLEFDRAAFEDILSTNRSDVEKLFREDTNGDGTFDTGILVSMNTFLDSYNDSVDGVIVNQVNILDDQISQLDDEIADFNERMDAKDAALKRQFTQAEQLLATLNSQSNFFASQLSNLTAASISRG